MPALLGDLERVRATLWARLNAAVTPANGNTPERLLGLAEAAELLHVTPDWLRRQKRFPFRIELSAGQVRYSARGIERWVAARQK